MTSYLGVVHLTTFLSPSAAQVISPPMLALAVVLFPIWIVLCLTTHDRREVITFAPQWCRRLATALFVYAGFNFFACLWLLEGGNPSAKGGEFALLSHGRLIRTLTAEEYGWSRAQQLRLMSGHLLALYAVAAAGLLSNTLRPKSQDQLAS
ncbi:MAG TPA: hypothetical protein DEA08_10585 [Planctomycetes bacterium]|nr:hypothetical protein [Planctomycetota bacterium]